MRKPDSFLYAVGYCLTRLLACHVLSASAPVDAADAFKRLTATEIRAQIIGSVVTDDSHWSDGYEPSGKLNAMELGQRKLGTWRLKGNEMCVTRKARKPIEECFEIWQSRQNIEYRSDGVTLIFGVLRRE